VFTHGTKRALFVALALAVLCLSVFAVTVLAADPTPAPSGLLIDPLDPRAGAGANRTGAPFTALVAVIGIGVVAAVATALYVRVTRAR
jgi:hypothetical protein